MITTMSGTTGRLATIAAAALALAATVAARRPEGAPAAAGACALVTRQEAASANGAPVPAGTEKAASLVVQGRPIAAQYCFYGPEVVIARFDLGGSSAATFEQYRQSLAAQPDYRTVTGVGDAAFAAKGQLAVRSGRTGLVVDVGQARGGGAAEAAAERVLAVLALGRL